MSSDQRNSIVEECRRRSPPELLPYVHRAVEELDRLVQAGHKSYSSVSFLEILNVAKQHQEQSNMGSLSLSHAGARAASATTTTKARTTLLIGALKQASPELKPYVSKAFAALDKSVREGKQTYNATNISDILDAATRLYGEGHHSTSAPQTKKTHMHDPNHDTQRQYQQPQHQFNSAAHVDLSGRMDPHDRKRSRLALLPEGGGGGSGQESETGLFFVNLCSGHCSGTDAYGAIGAVASPTSPAPAGSPVVGTSSDMERLYSRYEPRSADIRPPEVLRKAFAFVKATGERLEAEGSRTAALKYLNDQLKGMRQDLRVQNIVDDFAVSVYEFHALISLEKGELGEFNQCQAALKELYLSPHVNQKACAIVDFFCYRLVYLSLSLQYDSLCTEVAKYASLAESSPLSAILADGRRQIQQALTIVSACEEGNVSALCRVLTSSSEHMLFLLHMFLQRLRVSWLQLRVNALRGAVPVQYLATQLGFTPFTRKDGSVFYLDGSAGKAEENFSAMMALLQIDIPAPRESASVDAVYIQQRVESYAVFLTTRTDATIQL